MANNVNDWVPIEVLLVHKVLARDTIHGVTSALLIRVPRLPKCFTLSAPNQGAQYGLIGEYSLNHIMDPYMI